jgi:hypothetical protein
MEIDKNKRTLSKSQWYDLFGKRDIKSIIKIMRLTNAHPRFPTANPLTIAYAYFEEGDMIEIKDLMNDLGQEHQRMSASGQESYEKLCKLLGCDFKT